MDFHWKKLRRWGAGVWESLSFAVSPPNWEAKLSSVLPFGEPGEEFFEFGLTSCTQYLEYGAGASTLRATELGVELVCVESDARFLSSVERNCRLTNSASALHNRYLYADIGRTGPWGKPVLPTVKRPKTWRRYALAPWRLLGEGFRADFVLVDGRFRVACALAVVAHQPDTNWTMLVDDYVGRKHYDAIEQFAQIITFHGRMAQFQSKPNVDRSEVLGALDKYCLDWR